MSVYNAYPAHGSNASYYSQTHNSQPYQQQYPAYYTAPTTQQQQPPALDENSFRSLYTQRLGALTVNSRPIIQDLSMLAQNYPQMAHIVVESIERQVRMMSAPFKLPLFYLLDSIAKNAFHPYAAAFAPRIVRLFLDSYHAVDQPTQHKMREMMATWRSGSPDHRELFGSAVQSEIERVWGTSRMPTSNQVLTELDVVLVQKERAAQQNPYDELLPRHITALHELKRMIPTMNTSDLTATLTRLREMARASVSVVQQPPPGPTNVPNPYASFQAPQLPNYPPPPVANSFPPIPPSGLPAPLPATGFNAQNIISLLSSITSLQPGKLSVDTPVSVEISASMSLEDYEKAILQRKIKVTSTDISRTKPQILPFLYIKDSPQCNECGIRFPAGEDGKVKLRDHLDQHFRQNTKSSENVGRGFSRSWFVGRKNWVSDIPEHSLNKGKRPLAKMSEKQKAEVAEATRKELEAKYIIVPPGEEGKELRCAICMEKISLEFMEEDGDGDWVWKNAVKVDNKIYHATCHHDWANSTFNKQRLLEGEMSRQGTPDTSSRMDTTPLRLKSDSPKTPPSQLLSIAGTKRKAAPSIDTAKPASPSSKEGTPVVRGDDDEPRIKRRAIQV